MLFFILKKEIPNLLIEIEADMKKSAENLDFEKALLLRDKIKALKKRIEK